MTDTQLTEYQTKRPELSERAKEFMNSPDQWQNMPSDIRTELEIFVQAEEPFIKADFREMEEYFDKVLNQ
jgi:hypothetical protein